ncbi:hypothetical protein AciX8_2021 [Granulicella mallensis MP5ACTX8]|uniref:Uncharacterized protein n=1 Tax=Granulicella mallensis (strain ATCC BAA-1857 / DSM 23137 / MP5ACTX8) TaxID=682795 RepID=G8NTM7_GRAMM|nr:hypothetical protein AciX8_2021 [Granulicella mallensis MP5ACTX8]
MAFLGAAKTVQGSPGMHPWLGWAVSPQPKKAIQSLRPAGFTPAFGRDVPAFGHAMCGMAEPMPLTKQCHRKLFARFDLQFGSTLIYGSNFLPDSCSDLPYARR